MVVSEKEHLIEQLNSMISNGQFPEQSKLPPERDLAIKLNATRGKIRKALAVMEAEGKIWRQNADPGHYPGGRRPRLRHLRKDEGQCLSPRGHGLACG